MDEPKKLGGAHLILAENVAALMRHKETLGCLKFATPVGIQEHADKPVGKSTIYRILKQSTSPRLEQLERIAEALGVPAYALLVPGLNPAVEYEVVSKQEQAERERAIEERAEQRAAEMLNTMVGQLLARHDDREERASPDSSPDREVPASGPSDEPPHD